MKVRVHVIHDATSNNNEARRALNDLVALGLAGGGNPEGATNVMRLNPQNTHVVWAPKAQLAIFDGINVIRIDLSMYKHLLAKFLSKIAVHATYPVYKPAAPFG